MSDFLVVASGNFVFPGDTIFVFKFQLCFIFISSDSKIHFAVFWKLVIASDNPEKSLHSVSYLDNVIHRDSCNLHIRTIHCFVEFDALQLGLVVDLGALEEELNGLLQELLYCLDDLHCLSLPSQEPATTKSIHSQLDPEAFLFALHEDSLPGVLESFMDLSYIVDIVIED